MNGFKEFLLNKKSCWIVELVYFFIVLIFNLLMSSFNEELSRYVMSDMNTNPVEKAFNVLSYKDNASIGYIFVGFLLILFGLGIPVYLFYKFKSAYEYNLEYLFLGILISIINIILIFITLVVMSSPVLWALFIICGLVFIFMIAFSK